MRTTVCYYTQAVMQCSLELCFAHFASILVLSKIWCPIWILTRSLLCVRKHLLFVVFNSLSHAFKYFTINIAVDLNLDVPSILNNNIRHIPTTLCETKLMQPATRYGTTIWQVSSYIGPAFAFVRPLLSSSHIMTKRNVVETRFNYSYFFFKSFLPSTISEYQLQ